MSDRGLSGLDCFKNLGSAKNSNINDEKRLDSDKNVLNKLNLDRTVGKVEILPLHPGGRLKGAVTIPDPLKIIVGACAQVDTNKQVAKTFGLHPQTVSNIANGKRNNNRDTIDLDLRDKIHRASGAAIETARDLALARLMTSLNLITEDKLEDVKAIDLSTIARNMSAIHEKLGPKDTNVIQGNVIFYTPSQAKESDYGVIEISANSD